MGLFSGKTYYNAYAGSASLYEEQPATLESNILQTSIGNEGSMADAVSFTLQTDTFARAKAIMRYAARFDDPTREGGYVRGFPEANLNLVIVTPDQIEAALTRDVGDWDTILFTKAGTYDEIFMVEKVFQESYPGYFTGDPPSDTVWWTGLSEIDIPIINPDTGVYYKANNDPDIIRDEPIWDLANEDFYDGYIPPIPEFLGRYRVTFPYTDNTGTAAFWVIYIEIEPYITGSWIQVRYLKDGVEYYWAYKVGSGVDPILESYMDEEQLKAEFLPVAVLMHDRVWFNTDPESELTITTNKLLKKMGTTGDQVREDFEEAEAENPTEGGDKWDFFVHFAVPIHTNVRGAKEYLWYFFRELENWESFKAGEYYHYLASPSSAQPINEINITEAGISGYNVDYRWSYIHTSSHVGIWEVENTDEDKYGSGPTRPLRPREVAKELYELKGPPDTNSEYLEVIERGFGPGTALGTYGEDPEVSGYHDMVVLWRQRRDDELEPGDDPMVGRYDQMIIMGLSMQYRINTSEDGDLRFRYSVPELFGDEEETKEFRIPILYKSLLEVPTLHREEAVADGFCATVFLVQRVKVKWYQTGFFKWLIIIIAIVLIIYGFYNPEFLAAIASSVTATTTGVLYYIVLTALVFAMGWIISQAAINISIEFGSTAATLFIIFAAYMSWASGGGIEGLKDSFKALTQSPGWASAVSFINAAYPLYQMGFTVYSQRVLMGLEDDYNDFLADAKEKQQALRDAWDSFGPVPDWIDPMDLVNMFRRIGSAELANSYLDRTLQLNPGTAAYEAISQFTDIALIVPPDLGQGTVVDSMMRDFAKQRGAV